MDRKALIREYKGSHRPMGVFQVRNTLNGKCFIGTSVDLPSMLNRQRTQLRLGAHGNRELQQDWNTMGAEAFALDVLDTLPQPDQPDHDPTDDLRVLEQLWLDKLQPFDDRGYHPRPKHRA
jgi:hypothetical protein